MKNIISFNPTPTPNNNTGESFLDLLSPSGAEVILGQQPTDTLAVPLQPSATTMFGPRGACLVSETSALWIADTGHHRLLGWRKRPTRDGQPADWVIGQPDFQQEGQNAKGMPGAATVSVPTGISVCGKGLAVADAWNHRILIWQEPPEDSNVPADLVLGQTNFSQNQPNRGYLETAGDRLHWCYGVLYHQGKLFVADTGNRRVLIWNQLPESNGQPADAILGQSDFNLRDENGGSTPTASSMRWPHAIAIWQDNLIVADAGNNRIMVWDGIPTENNTPCQIVLGQPNFSDVELNQSNYFPSAKTLSMPYGVAVYRDWILVADSANSRLLGWRDLATGIAAQALTGQAQFNSKSENRSYGQASRDSLCWSYGIQVCGDTAIVADSGNNRILLWSLAELPSCQL